MMDLFDLEFVAALIAAAVLGGILGFEREIHGRPAGLRTHLLVSLGSAVFMLLSPYVADMGKGIPADPGRIAAQIVTGIGFLGAGAIVKEGISVRGLTTAACLWIAAAIGMTAGAGRIGGAILVTAIALFALVILPKIEGRLRKHTYRVLEITTPLAVKVDTILETVSAENVLILRYAMERDYAGNTLTTSLVLRLQHSGITDKYIQDIVGSLELLELAPLKITWHPR